MKTRIVTLLLGLTFVFIHLNRFKWAENNTLSWDKTGYYAYLPAVFIHQDLRHMNFLQEAIEKYKMGGTVEEMGFHHLPNGSMPDKYPVGVAIFELPFFLIGHGTTKISNIYEADGFSAFYRLAICMATVFWSVAGLWVLGNFLNRYYDDLTTFFTILLIGLGSNLYCYTAFDAGMSHPFSFFLFAAFVNLTDLVHRDTKLIDSILLGFVAGLIIVTRPSNIVILVLLVFWRTKEYQTISEKFRFLKKNYSYLVLPLIGGLSIVAVQLSYWKYVTNSWVYYSYPGEGFDFTNVEIWKGLLSYRKGWFVYTPLAFCSLWGLFVLTKEQQRFVFPLVIFFASNIAVVFAWHQWYYGGGFGARALVESLAILALPLASLLKWVKEQKALAIKLVAGGIFSLCILLNLFQTYQYSIGILPWDKATKEYYWSVFGRLEKDEAKWRALELE
jgi:hypothetical protein